MNGVRRMVYSARSLAGCTVRFLVVAGKLLHKKISLPDQVRVRGRWYRALEGGGGYIKPLSIVSSRGPGAVRTWSSNDGSALRTEALGNDNRCLFLILTAGDSNSSLWCLEYDGGGPDGVEDWRLAVSAIEFAAMAICLWRLVYGTRKNWP